MVLAASAFGAGVAALDYVLPPYDQFVVARIALLVIVTVSLNLLMGITGLLSLASAAFMGIGAYGVVIAVQQHSVPLIVAIPLVVAATWCLGWVLGIITLRLSHFYLALVTLGFLVAFHVVLQRGGERTGGGYGLISPIPEVAGRFVDFKWVAVSATFTAGFTVVLAWSLVNSRIGRAWRTMKANPIAAELSGMRLARLKTSAFAVSAGLASLAGCGYAFLQQTVSPAAFDIARTIDHLVYVIVGGTGSMLGTILGPTVLELAPEMMRSLGEYRQLFFGAMLLAILILAPRGLAGFVQGAYTRFAPNTTREMRLRVDRLLDVAPRADEEPLPIKPHKAPAAVKDAPAVEFNDVVVRYGGLVAVNGLSFTVRRGELHGLIGPNGAGKTTAINALSGLVGVQSGSILLDGHEVRGRRIGVPASGLAAYGVARTFQTPLVVPELSALENVMVGLHSQLRAGLVTGALNLGFVRREERAARQRSREVLDLLGFGIDPDVPVRTLGFGPLRKLEIARAIVGRPRLLLLDEPTSGLEVDAAVSMLEQLQELQRRSDGELTIIIVEHNVPLLFAHCGAVTAMVQGKDVITASPDLVRRDPDVRRSYLGEQLAVEEAVARTDSGSAYAEVD
jgi:branched-chain amino acid transport system permease protein